LKVYVVEKIEVMCGRTKLMFAKSPPSEIMPFTPVTKFYKNSLHVQHTASVSEIIKMFNYVNTRQNKFVVDTSTTNYESDNRYDYDYVWKTVYKNPLPIKKVGDFKNEISLRTRT
jgi:hypothetical protein